MRKITRAIRIIRTLSRHQVDRFVDATLLPWHAKIFFSVIILLSRSPFAKKMNAAKRAEHLRLAFEELGPVFIKFGQAISTRRDLLPTEVANELAKLQDHVPPFDGEIAVTIIEQSLGQSITELFIEFSLTPIASASIAQVHAATLSSGEHVAVKVLRPHIESVIDTDTRLMQKMARIIERLSAQGRRLKLTAVVNDYRDVIFNELDLLQEAGNTSLLRQHFENSQILYVPIIYWNYTKHNVMVSEFIHGIPISDIEQLHAENTNMRELAERGVDIFFTQVFEHNFFHADMHPGNIFVDCSKPETPKYIALDCAIMGALSDSDRYYVARNLLAALERDYDQVAHLLIQANWVPEDTPPFALAATIRSACEPIFNKPLHQISFAGLLINLFHAAQRFGMEVQPSLVLLQKTMLNIEGLGRELYPELDLWQTALPFLNRWREQRYSVRRLIKRARQRAPELIEELPLIIDAARQTLKAKNGKDPTPSKKSEEKPGITTGVATVIIIATAVYLLGIPHTGFANPDPSMVALPLLGAAFLLLWKR